jgi:hypothetical protein
MKDNLTYKKTKREAPYEVESGRTLTAMEMFRRSCIFPGQYEAKYMTNGDIV